MLKKLRLKFILINMGIVTVILCAIFFLMFYSTSNSLERESIQMMESVSMNPLRSSIPGVYRNDFHVPYFTVERSITGEIVRLGGGNYDLSDEDTVNAILEEVDKRESNVGVLKSYGLRYLRRDTLFGECIVFSDMSSERATLNSLTENFLLIGGSAFLCFLVISFLLARWAVKPVEKAWIQQKQFVADASHELKTPLTVIMTDAELLCSSQDASDDSAKLSSGILSMAEQMRGLVESLLELARIDNGTVKGEIGTVSFSDTVLNEAMTFDPIFFEKELSFTYEVDEGISLKANTSHLKQLTDVYLDNAAKYASPGGEVKLTLKHISPKKCLLTVANQGEEIPQSEIPQLFKRFYRSDKVRAMNHSYGLGLSIAQSIAEEHKGRVWAESKDGWNSFFAELPL